MEAQLFTCSLGEFNKEEFVLVLLLGGGRTCGERAQDCRH
jgi:hypothetical protein